MRPLTQDDLDVAIGMIGSADGPTSTVSVVSFPGLTQRELAVARALCAGKTSHEIAADMSITVKTVDTHRLHVMKKLLGPKVSVANNVRLVLLAVRNGWITP